MKKIIILLFALMITLNANAQNTGVGNIEVPISKNVVKLLKLDSLIFYSHMDVPDTAINAMMDSLHFTSNNININVVAGQVGNALQFDGIDDSLISDYAKAWDVNEGSFTWTMWFKHESGFTNKEVIIDRFDKGGTGYRIEMAADSTILFYMTDDDALTCDSVQTDTSYVGLGWYFLAVIRDIPREQAWIYIGFGGGDTTNITITKALGDLDGDADQVVRMGTDVSNTYFYNGELDEVMFWRGIAFTKEDCDFLCQMGKSNDFYPPYIFERIYVDTIFARIDTIFIESPIQSDSSAEFRELLADSVQADTIRTKYLQVIERGDFDSLLFAQIAYMDTAIIDTARIKYLRISEEGRFDNLFYANMAYIDTAWIDTAYVIWASIDTIYSDTIIVKYIRTTERGDFEDLLYAEDVFLDTVWAKYDTIHVKDRLVSIQRIRSSSVDTDTLLGTEYADIMIAEINEIYIDTLWALHDTIYIRMRIIAYERLKIFSIDVDTLFGLDSAYSALWHGDEFRGRIANFDSIFADTARFKYLEVTEQIDVIGIINISGSISADSAFFDTTRTKYLEVTEQGDFDNLLYVRYILADSMDADTVRADFIQARDSLLVGYESTIITPSKIRVDTVEADTARFKYGQFSELIDNDATYLWFRDNNQPGDHFTIHDRLKFADMIGLVSLGDWTFEDVYDTDLTVTMPRCTVMFHGRIDTLTARNITLTNTNTITFLWTHEDSTSGIITESTSDPCLNDNLKLGCVVLGEFKTSGTYIELYKRSEMINQRWKILNRYTEETHENLVISGLTITQGRTNTRSLKMASGEIHYGLYHFNIDSTNTYLDVNVRGDSTLAIHWGVGTGNDSVNYYQQFPVDSVFDYTNNTTIEATNNRYYKALAWLDGREFAIQMADELSSSATVAAALLKDEPPINTDNLDRAIRLYWIVYQAKIDNTGNFNTVSLTDVRDIHGTATGGAGVADHGELSGLGDDDHIQYLLRSALGDSIAAHLLDSLSIIQDSVAIWISDSIQTVLKLDAVDDSVSTIITDSLVNYLQKVALKDSLNNVHIITSQWTFQDTVTFTDDVKVENLDGVTGDNINVRDTLSVNAPVKTNDLLAYSGDRIGIENDSLIIWIALVDSFWADSGYVKYLKVTELLDIDSTNIANDKIGFEDIRNLPEEIALLLYKAAFGDSIGNVDSTYITNDYLGFEDIHNLPETIALLLYKAAFGDSVGNVDSTYITNDYIGFEDVRNLPENIALLLYKVALKDSLNNDHIITGNNTFSGTLTINGKVNQDSINLIGEPLPFYELDITDFYADVDLYPHADYVDTIEVFADDSTIRGGYYPGMQAKVPDSTDTSFDGNCIQLQTVDMVHRRQLEPYYDGVDSIVFDVITNCGVDSANAKVEVWLDDGDGHFAFMDSTTAIASNGVWLHDATLTTLGDLRRYGRLKLVIRFQSINKNCSVTVARIRIYPKKAS